MPVQKQMPVKKLDLGQLTPLASGGFGQVFRTDEYHLPGDDTPLAYKEFTIKVAEQGLAAEAAVTFRDQQNAEERDQLDKYYAWPRELVEDDSGKICGLLMPLIPPEFFCRLRDPDTGQMTTKPREMQWLITRDAQRRAAEIDLSGIDGTDRLFLLTLLAYAIGWLHKRGWVFGDLSLKNAAFAVDPPQIILFDCDGAAALGNLKRKQSSTPFWDPPECPIQPPAGQRRQQELQDNITDTYKLGLAILRCLSPGRGASTSRSLGRIQNSLLDSAGLDLLGRALSANRADRPTAKELFTYLERFTSPRIVVPQVASATLLTPFRLPGQKVRFEWQIANANHVKVLIDGKQTWLIEAAKCPTGYATESDRSGLVVIEVENKYGVVTVDLGELTQVELPQFTATISDLPRPEIPAIEAFSVESLTAMLTGHPSIELNLPELPAVLPPRALDLVDDLIPDRSVTVPGPRVDDAVIAASNAVTSLITSETRKYMATLRQAMRGNANV
jgi:hypothetical protein